MTARGAAWAVSTALIVGTPFLIYADVTENSGLIVLAAILSVLIGLVICLIDGLSNKTDRFDFSKLAEELVPPFWLTLQ